MADTIGTELINRIAEALKNVAAGLNDVNVNTKDTKTAINTLNTNFQDIFGIKSPLSKLLLKEQIYSKSSKTHLSSIDNKLGGLTELIKINRDQLDELKKLTPAGLSGADKPGGPGGGPGSSLTKKELSDLLAKSSKGLLSTRNLLLGGGAAAASAIGLPQMMWKVLSTLKSAIIPYLLLQSGRAYADEGIGQIGLPGMGGWEGRQGTGVLGTIAREAVGGQVLGAIGPLEAGLGTQTFTKGGRRRLRAMGRGVSHITGLTAARRGEAMFSKSLYKRLSGFTGERMTAAGRLRYLNGKVVGIKNAAGNWVTRGTGRRASKGFIKALAVGSSKSMSKGGLRAIGGRIPLVGLLIELGFTVWDANQLMSEGGADVLAAWKEEFANAGLLGKGFVIYSNPASAIEAAQDIAWAAMYGTKSQREKDIKFMDPAADRNSQEYQKYQKLRMNNIKAIMEIDDGENYPYGYPGFAPMGYKTNRPRKMTMRELLTRSLTELEVIRKVQQEVSRKLIKDPNTGKMTTFAGMKAAREERKQAKSAAESKAAMSYRPGMSWTDLDKARGQRLRAMYDKEIILPQDLRYMSPENQRLLDDTGIDVRGTIAHFNEQQTAMEAAMTIGMSPSEASAAILKMKRDVRERNQLFLKENYRILNDYFRRQEIRDTRFQTSLQRFLPAPVPYGGTRQDYDAELDDWGTVVPSN